MQEVFCRILKFFSYFFAFSVSCDVGFTGIPSVFLQHAIRCVLFLDEIAVFSIFYTLFFLPLVSGALIFPAFSPDLFYTPMCVSISSMKKVPFQALYTGPSGTADTKYSKGAVSGPVSCPAGEPGMDSPSFICWKPGSR